MLNKDIHLYTYNVVQSKLLKDNNVVLIFLILNCKRFSNPPSIFRFSIAVTLWNILTECICYIDLGNLLLILKEVSPRDTDNIKVINKWDN